MIISVSEGVRMRIGNIAIKDDGLVLGPMAGVTDLPFRLLCREQGAALAYTEMVSAKAVLYKNKNTKELLATCNADSPLGLQLFGSEPDIVAEAARILEDGPWQIIDFNMGCPVPKVVNNGEGSALMKDPVLAGKIVEALVKAVKKPVTVKIRKGFDDEHVNAPEVAHILQESGAAAVTVHGRTRQQYYHGQADWSVIAAVKAAVSIPVIGNGDVTCCDDARRMRSETGCDGVMVARAACGNPWVFRKDTREIGPQELRHMMRRHLELQVEYRGEKQGVLEMRKHLAWYSKGSKGGAAFREFVNRIETPAEMLESIDNFFK
jgi:tRNA-dihydrouridine synthase B